MTLILSLTELLELYEQHAQNQTHNVLIDEFESFSKLPKCLGEGYQREIDIAPGVGLVIFNNKYDRDVVLKVPIHDHLVQFSVLSSGLIHHDAVYPVLGGKCTYLSGSGVSPAYVARYQKSQHIVGVSIEIEPQLLQQFLVGSAHSHLELFIKDNDWKESFFPEVTPAMQVVVQQILNCPYQRVTKRLYLQGKVFELLAMQLNPILAEWSQLQPSPRLKPDTIEKLYHARDILTRQLENPPSLLELAQQVGISDRTLRRGFQKLFGTTVFGYLTYQRMKRSEQLLLDSDRTIAEVANMVGYCHLGHFAAAFKRHFGITPSEVGRRTIRGLSRE
ncbi:transcriptional regulator, AraC family [Gloeocapsa sp. PCC 7428]|uniref:helix-turn-helix transcriptional regulator n=1 Tax=Gloeocapsa sp. PCC 7428 TaxID=1173026 RepID=UPI0002A5C858|nr:AraC family transcriptional regulator [Gloeocapsa sp. PCC 7428]AFZ28905.1 transcriptional regulator, AraC family [Gloeocapsa sp. PCC 7428]